MNGVNGANGSAPSSTFSIGTIAIIMVSLVLIYFAYSFLYGSPSNSPTVLVPKEIKVTPTPLKSTDIPQPFEGGDYTFNTWVYIENFRNNMNERKPIFELQGKSNNAFSTLYVGLGAKSNTLVVRTHSAPASAVQGFQSGSGSATTAPAPAPGTQATSSASDGTLMLPYSLNFKRGMDPGGDGDTGLANPEPICDLPSIDLQRWVMITVVLSGRTIDVYMDGKLTRSCVTKSYYKVDPEGVTPVILGGGNAGKTPSMSGSIAGLSVARYALTPGEIYRMYSNGPKANQTFMDSLMASVNGTPA